MIVLPAIDLKNGACVRLVKGEMAAATTFNPDPADQARRFAAAGAGWLHVVDLDGAFAGRSVNSRAVEAILAATGMKIELGGGIRDMTAIEGWLDKGVTRVILGTVAVKNPALVRAACERFPGRIAVGIDARGGRVATEGWADTSDMDAAELAEAFEDAGVAAIIHTDIDRDGAMGGPNVAATAALAARLKTPVIVSGGVSREADLDAIAAMTHTGIVGAIVGRALYDGRIDLKRVLAKFGGKEDGRC